MMIRQEGVIEGLYAYFYLWLRMDGFFAIKFTNKRSLALATDADLTTAAG